MRRFHPTANGSFIPYRQPRAIKQSPTCGWRALASVSEAIRLLVRRSNAETGKRFEVRAGLYFHPAGPAATLVGRRITSRLLLFQLMTVNVESGSPHRAHNFRDSLLLYAIP